MTNDKDVEERSMRGESVETRLARLEEAMTSVKGDTIYIRKGFDGFKESYWKKMMELSGKVAGISVITSLVTGVITAIIAHAMTNAIR